ncbi:hypothetical protein MQE23_30140 [Streptomyces sp. HP-A2021]|uniref:hypothetical protein n=1 Tax=Streptomyces sp. HP-A2021 TaxID=2927875 RepID=UPI001FAFB6CE|nr:hypothetical protein [Streptomyces sp. HP-A2021]UOB13051.1 hypothetical protein MQE23_30140 [Streptomyces sp. HP-A2021]
MEARHSALCVEEAEDAVKELRAELAKGGIIQPSPGLHPVNLVRDVPCPLVESGRCSVRTARRLAAVPR